MGRLEKKLVWIWVFIMVLSFATYGQTEETPNTTPILKYQKVIEEQNKDENEEKSFGKVKDEKLEDSGDLPRRRIVSREQIKKSESAISRFLLAPFRAIAPAINSRVTKFENERELNQLGIFLSNPSIYPTFGSLGEGSGFGAGVYLSTADKLSENFKLFASGHATFSKYTDIRGGIEITPTKFANGKLRFNLTGRFLLSPEEDFFGIGATSFRSNRTSYFRRERGARFEADWQVLPKLKIGAFTDFSYNSITNGKDRTVARLTEIFSPQTISGISRTVRLLDNGAFLEYEGRDEPENPHAGTFARFSVSSTDGLGSENDFGAINHDIDARGYLPLGSKRRVLAVRFLGNFKDLKANSTIPFFRLARLGDAETLRGYESYRFQGLNAVHLNIEYRFKLVQGIETGGFHGVEAIFFSDSGQVFDRREELSARNIRTTWGGGIQFIARKSVAFTILYAKSPERSRVIFRFGKTF